LQWTHTKTRSHKGAHLVDIEVLAKTAVDCGLQIHKEVGPGLLETAYERILFQLLIDQGLNVRRQVDVPITFKGIVIENAFRADLLIENQLLIELKSVEANAPVHAKQVLTYLHFLNLPLGLLMNFGLPTFKEGVRRVANGYFRQIK
jgi:GxxExxY protein